MAISVKHAFTSPKADGVDSTLVQPSNWNAEHTLTLAAGKVLGRNTSSAGAAQELPLAFDTAGNAALSATGFFTTAVGTTAERPGTPVTGMFRFNSSLVKFEGYNGTAWSPVGGGGATISDTAPGSPSAGDLWWNSANGQMYTYYNDGTSSQWVVANSFTGGSAYLPLTGGTLTGAVSFFSGSAAAPSITTSGDTNTGIFFPAADTIAFAEGGTEAARIDSSGNLLVGKTASGIATVGVQCQANGLLICTRDSDVPFVVNRNTNDGTLVSLRQDNTEEGTISVSGTTVSYNGGHLSRWSQLPTDQRDPALLKGTVLSNLDEMCVWLDAEGNPLPNEQLNKMKISDVEGDVNVAGVFVNWDNDDQTYTYDMNVAMTGDMIIRIAQGVVVQKGDLLMSAGDGTAKPQGDDIIRSKTVAKVTSNHVTCTYEDGSYCVPCVLMAC